MMTIRICIVALHAYPVIDPSASGVFGGTETRAWTIAQGLAKLPGVDITFVVRNEKLKKPSLISKVNVVPYNHSLHLLRFQLGECLSLIRSFPYLYIRRWKWSLPWMIIKYIILRIYYFRKLEPLNGEDFYRNIEADYYCAFGVHSTALSLISSAKSISKKSILFLGADTDLDERYQPDSTYITPYHERAGTCYSALMNTDLVITQKEEQQILLKSRFHRNGYLFPNPIDIPAWQQSASTKNEKWQKHLMQSTAHRCPENYVLWIGRAETFHKKADLMLKVSQALPHIPFLMIMNQRDHFVEEMIWRNKPDNLFIIESVPFEFMPSVFSQAAFLLNTSSSEFEGFPNVFLQAAGLGVRIISLETGEEFIKNTHCGICVNGDLTTLINEVEKYWSTPLEKSARDRMINIVKEQHDLDRLCRDFLQYLNS